MKIILTHVDYIQVWKRGSVQKLITNASAYHLEISVDKINIVHQRTTDELLKGSLSFLKITTNLPLLNHIKILSKAKKNPKILASIKIDFPSNLLQRNKGRNCIKMHTSV